MEQINKFIKFSVFKKTFFFSICSSVQFTKHDSTILLCQISSDTQNRSYPHKHTKSNVNELSFVFLDFDRNKLFRFNKRKALPTKAQILLS